MSDSPIVGGRPGSAESPVTLNRTRSGSSTVKPQPVTEQSLMEYVAGQFYSAKPSGSILYICQAVLKQRR